MKTIVMYLPQYHEVEENSTWWGKGFTDWDAVKAAEPLFNGHRQPNIPLNHYYYDLTDKNTLQWQADLMKKYGIYGICCYHYWFEKGRKILEKPAENLLKWKDIDIPFCFCWANESWIRTWSKIESGNAWADKMEPKEHEKGNGILLRQDYGGVEDWTSHFDYLKPFFKDSRYIKIKNKPVFLFYVPNKIVGLKKMLQLWNQLAVDLGFDGVYSIGINDEKMAADFDAVLCHEPQMSIWHNISLGKIRENPYVCNELAYDDVWNSIISYHSRCKKVYYGGFSGFDDTPRKGKNGTVISGATPEKFERYFAQLLAKNDRCGNEFTFINAWNEWGEGMYIEPDSENGYKYLEAVKAALSEVKNHVGSDAEIGYFPMPDREEIKKDNVCNDVKYKSYCRTLDKWLSVKEKNKKISDCLLKKGLERIGIYGIGMIGRHLLAELEESGVYVVCGIDRNYMAIKNDFGINVISPDDEIPLVDAIVVTTPYIYDDIYDAFRKKIECDIISIDLLLDEC